MTGCRVSLDERENDRQQQRLDDLLEAFKSSPAYESAVTHKLIQLQSDPELYKQLRAEAEEFVEESWRDYE